MYKSVNKALRTEDIDALYTFRVYITHLRNRIAQLHNELRRKSVTGKANIVRLYRGLKMSKAEIEQMRANEGALISMNGFFSTSRDIEQAVHFATKPSQRQEVVGVLLEIEGNVESNKMIFADIAEFSAFPEEKEVLFDLATVFKIVNIQYDTGKKLWVMQLNGKTSLRFPAVITSMSPTGIDKSSYKVNEYIKNIGKDSEENNFTLLFGRLVRPSAPSVRFHALALAALQMYDMGEYSKSEKYFKRILQNLPQNHPDVPKIYFHLGRVCYLRGLYQPALKYYEDALAVQRRQIAPEKQSLDIARTLHNIGNIYLDQKQTKKALEFYEEALEMKRAKLADCSESPSIATTLSSIATIHRREGRLNDALSLYQQAYEMKKLALPAEHPSIADSLNNLGIVYEDLDEHEQALACYEKSLGIKEKALPASHPSISATLNNMGIIYRKRDEYDKALSCYNQALQIEQSVLSSDHLDIADTYNNLCTLYYVQSIYDKAIDMAQCKLAILRKHYKADDQEVINAENVIREMQEEWDDEKKLLATFS